jgi:hypothetical protein
MLEEFGFAGARALHGPQLDGAEHGERQHDGRGPRDPGQLDPGVPVDRRPVGIVAVLGPPEGQRVPDVDQHAEHYRRGNRGQHGEVELLVGG